MNGAHDLGGKHGFGKIDDSRVANFEAEWEEKVFALTLACGMLGQWNLDQSRQAREQMDPAHYLNSSYYEHWLAGLEQLLIEKNLLTEAELNSGRSQNVSGLQPAGPEKMQQILDVGSPTELELDRCPGYEIGDRVVVIADNPYGHTRAPAYVKGKPGAIVKHHGAHIFADEHAASGQKVGEHLYTVKFEAIVLWGLAGHEKAGNESVYVDLFEPYLISTADYKRQLDAS